MYRKIFLFLITLAIAASSYATDRNKATHPASQGKITPCAPGFVYIQFKVGSTVIPRITSKGAIAQSAGANAFQRVLAKLGLLTILPFDPAPMKDSISRSFGIDRMYCMYYSNRNIDPHTALAMLESTGEIQCGSVRYIFPLSIMPDDPLLNLEYGLTKMNVFNAWNTTTGDTSIVIADVDNAINIDHQDLVDEIQYNWGETGIDAQGHDKRTNGIDDDSDGYIDNWEGWDFVGDVNAEAGDVFQPNNNPRPREASVSHGTHTAGCILATGNNSVGIAGVAYGCRLIALKAGGSDGLIDAGYEGIHYASTHNARIINCSWGGPIDGSDTAYANVFLEEAIARNVLVVAAAGNGVNDNSVPTDNDNTPEYPANGPSVLSVGATDQNDQPASFSNYGHSVSVWAPGVGIWSCDYPGDSAYSSEDGTSFACPYTAGVAGLLWSVHKSWTPEFISKQLIATCDNVVDPSDRNDYWGRINAGTAITTAPTAPGLIITSYSLDGVVSDSLKPGSKLDLKVTFENVLAAGANLSATPISSLGATLSTTKVLLGSMGENVTSIGDFQITRTGVFSQGTLPVQFAVTNGTTYTDTLTIYMPLSVLPGFVVESPGNFGSSIKRVSNSVAWAAFGYIDQTTDQVLAQYSLESGGLWQDTTTLSDGTTAPYDVEALDSMTAFFGTGQSNAGSVISTNDGGQTFNYVAVSSFTPFVDGIHFFDSANGILIGDPKSGSSKWGIGVTTDGGQTWNPLAKPVSAAGSIAGWNNSMAWVGNNGWFGTNAEKILRTTNAGVTWTAVSTTYQNSLGIGFDDDAAHGIATFQPVLSATTGATSGTNGIMTTSDSGSSWTALTTLPAPGITPGLVQFIPNTTTAILTSNMGVYRTTDFGVTWTPIGIPVSFTPDDADISISRGSGQFVVSIISSNNGVATYTEALADDTTSKDSTANEGVNEITSQTLSFDISPNPSRSISTITFELPEREEVTINLIDAMGRNIKLLLKETLDPGPYPIELDTRDLPQGTYYATFETSSGIHLTRAITVLR